MYLRTPLLTSTACFSNLISRSVFRCGLLLISVSWLASSSETRAVSPPPDGGYPNANTAEGDFALQSLTSGANNTAIGASALYNNTSGDQNTASGVDALLNNTEGRRNTATGSAALLHSGGNDNTASGANALFSNTAGDANTASGAGALQFNTIGIQNTASGFEALFSNSTGEDNTANGFWALFRNTTGIENTANGATALYANTTGSFNAANGAGALGSNTTGTENTASGVDALLANTTGSFNAANGALALESNTSGADNTGSGVEALDSNTIGHDNMADGFRALRLNTTGSNNIALGSNAGSNLTTGSNNIDIGAPGVAGEANAIRIGKSATQKKTFIAGIRGVTVASGVGVIVGSSGQLGTVVSSARFKEAIKPMDKASEDILALKPVTFRYKPELDPDGIPQFGLVAEQVAKVNPDLVVRDEDGRIYTVRYEAVNAMLLNEFLKEHRQVQELKGTVAQQQKQIEALTAGLQKVTAQVALSKPEPQLVANP